MAPETEEIGEIQDSVVLPEDVTPLETEIDTGRKSAASSIMTENDKLAVCSCC